MSRELSIGPELLEWSKVVKVSRGSGCSNRSVCSNHGVCSVCNSCSCSTVVAVVVVAEAL